MLKFGANGIPDPKIGTLRINVAINK